MRRSIYIVLLPLFLILLFGVSSVPSFHSDFRNSVLSKTTSISNSVMGPKPMFRRTKRDTSEDAIGQRRTKSNCILFGGHQYDEARSKKSKTMSDVQIAERSNQSENINGFEYYDERFRNQNQNNFCTDDNGRSPSTMVPRGNQYSSINSRRWKTLSQPIMIRENQLGEMSNQNVDIMEDRDQQEVVQITDEYQHSYGQASYQRSKQGSAIAYEDSVIRRTSTEDTMLTAWFQANKTYPEARGLTYTEFPTKFVWHDDKKYWAPRKRYEMIGRITYVPPTAGITNSETSVRAHLFEININTRVTTFGKKKFSRCKALGMVTIGTVQRSNHSSLGVLSQPALLLYTKSSQCKKIGAALFWFEGSVEELWGGES